MSTTNTGIMQLTLGLPNTAENNFRVATENFYQQINSLSNTIISLQYKPKQFLSFKLNEAKLGAIVRQGVKEIALQCQIRGTTYTFTSEHVEQMSKRELNDLLNYLGIDGNQWN